VFSRSWIGRREQWSHVFTLIHSPWFEECLKRSGATRQIKKPPQQSGKLGRVFMQGEMATKLTRGCVARVWWPLVLDSALWFKRFLCESAYLLDLQSEREGDHKSKGWLFTDLGPAKLHGHRYLQTHVPPRCQGLEPALLDLNQLVWKPEWSNRLCNHVEATLRV